MKSRELPADPMIRSLISQARSSQLNPAYPARRRRSRRRGARARRMLDRGSGQAEAGRRQVGVGQDADLGELGGLHRRGRRRQIPDPRGVHEEDRHQGQLRRGRRRQQHLLRQGQGPARPRPGHRRRHGLPHRLDGRPLDPARLHPEARPREHPEHARTSPRRSRTSTSTPGRTMSLPWQGGFAGICWNKDKLPGGLTSVDDLWDPPLKGRVGVLSRDARHDGPASCWSRASTSSASWGDDDFTAAIDVLKKQVERRPDPQHQGQLVHRRPEERRHSRRDLLVGRHHPLNAEAGDNWEFAIPDAGGTLWNDNFVVPIGSPHKTNAEDADQLLLRARGRGRGRRLGELHHAGRRAPRRPPMAIDPELADNQLIFPDDDDPRERARVPHPDRAPRSRSTRRSSRAVLLGA